MLSHRLLQGHNSLHVLRHRQCSEAQVTIYNESQTMNGSVFSLKWAKLVLSDRVIFSSLEYS